jgi:hypothetical protein
LLVAQGDFRMRSSPAMMMSNNDMGTGDMAMSSGDMASGGACNTDSRCGSSCGACSGGTPHCKSDGSQCVQCNAKSDCSGLTPCCVNNACAAGLC